MGIGDGRLGGGRRSKEWMEWLSDDPPAAPVAREIASRPRQRAQDPSGQPQGGISVSITVPRFKKPVLPYRKIATWGAIGASVIAVGIGVDYAPKIVEKFKDTPSTDVLSASKDATRPTFDLLFRDGKPPALASNTGAYDRKNNSAAYVDTVGGVKVNVHQQPLPSQIKEDADAGVKKIAQDYSATRELTTSSPVAYIGKQAGGAQTVIFHKKGLLVFLVSADTIDDHDWADYITRLK